MTAEEEKNFIEYVEKYKKSWLRPPEPRQDRAPAKSAVDRSAYYPDYSDHSPEYVDKKAQELERRYRELERDWIEEQMRYREMVKMAPRRDPAIDRRNQIIRQQIELTMHANPQYTEKTKRTVETLISMFPKLNNLPEASLELLIPFLFAVGFECEGAIQQIARDRLPAEWI